VRVLIRQWIADQRIVGRVGAAAEAAEGRRNSPRLNVDAVSLPRPNPDVERVSLGPAEIFGAKFGQKRDPRPGLDRGGEIQPHGAQQRVVVVAVVEEAAVIGARAFFSEVGGGTAEGRRHVAADGDVAIAEHDRVGGQGLRSRLACSGQRQAGDDRDKRPPADLQNPHRSPIIAPGAVASAVGHDSNEQGSWKQASACGGRDAA